MNASYVGAFAVALCLMAGDASAASVVSSLFGNRVSENTRFRVPYATLDFAGDGRPDQLYVVSIAPGSPNVTIASDVTVLPDIFETPPTPLGSHAETIALAVVFSKSGRKFLITDCDANSIHFFDPNPLGIWATNPIPLTVAKRGSATFNSFKKQDTQIANDIMVLGTEASIPIALFWNGTTFVVFWPDEEP